MDATYGDKVHYCRGSLGPNAHRYWRMRYCSVDCVTAYQRRLEDGTVMKIHLLESQLGDSRILAARQGRIRKEAA
jgi:hypothetical protein